MHPRSSGPRRSLAAVAVLAGPLLLPAPALCGPASQETSVAALAQSHPEAGEGRLAQRVLHLANGQLLRGSTRRRDGRWEWRGHGAWKTLPPGQVVRVVDEKELLREFNERRNAVGDIAGDRARARIALWNWMADEGLYAETLEEVDEVLARDPHREEACTFLRERDLFVVLPELPVDLGEREHAGKDLTRFLRFAATAPAAVRELCLARLSLSHAQAERLFSSELNHASSRRRELAAVGLGRLVPGTQGRALLVHSVFDPTQDVRTACAQSLGAAGDPALTMPLTRALASDSKRVSQRAVEALGAAGYAEAVGPLVQHLASLSSKPAGGGAARPPAAHIFVGTQRAYVQDFDVEVAAFAAVADPQINVITGGVVLDVRVLGLHTVSFRTRRATVCRVLRRLTGESWGDRPQEWIEWWRSREPGSPAAPTTDGGEAR
jgi:hypothetical protein